jgi:hypothetical protein
MVCVNVGHDKASRLMVCAGALNLPVKLCTLPFKMLDDDGQNCVCLDKRFFGLVI